jgi:hypothetical protein
MMFVAKHGGGRRVTSNDKQYNGNVKISISNGKTYLVFSPVVVSNIRAIRLQPVAKYLPLAENLTQHTTLPCSRLNIKFKFNLVFCRLGDSELYKTIQSGPSLLHPGRTVSDVRSHVPVTGWL